VEKRRITLEARASASLAISTVTFEANGKTLPAVTGPVFTTAFDVPARAQSPTLTIAAVGRDASGAQVARDEVTVSVVVGLQVAPTLIGVPHGGTSTLSVQLSSPIPADLPVMLTVGDPAIVKLPAGPVVVSAGQTQVGIPVAGAAVGNTTITVSSTRGDAAAVASVSDPVAKTLAPSAPPVGTRLLPVPTVGQLFTVTSGQRTVTAQLLSAPASTPIAVIVTSTNPAVARVEGPVSIAAGSQTAALTIVTGAEGTAVLTLRAGSELRQITVIVGTPPAGTLGPIVAAPVGVTLLPVPSAGRVFTSPAGQATFAVVLLSVPAPATTIVTVVTSNVGVATVPNFVQIEAGQRSAAVTVTTGTEGSAVLTFQAGTEVRQLTVVVGPPPAGDAPLTLASPVGARVSPVRSAGLVFTPTSAEQPLTVALLGAPSATAVPVTVVTTDPSVATVSSAVSIPAGQQSATLIVTTGTQGVATLTVEASGERRQVVVVVGTPPASMIPTVFAPVIGVEVKP